MAEISAVFVNGFDFDTTQAAVEAHMGMGGTVLSVDMKKGSAVVTYTSPFEAQAAVSTLNKTTIAGNTRFIDVKLDTMPGGGEKRSWGGGEDGNGGSTKVGVSGFDFETTDEQLMTHMGQVGTVTGVFWTTKGSANVVYSSADEATLAIKTLTKTVIPGNTRFIDVIPGGDRAADSKRFKGSFPGLSIKDGGWAFMSGFGGKGKGAGKGGKGSRGGKDRDHTDEDPAGSGRVFVRGFDFGTTDEQLLGHMSQMGPIHAVHWVNKGNAVVVYSNKASAAMAISSLDNTTIPGNTRFINVCERQ